MNLRDELHDLEKDKNPQRRGRRFELLLAAMLEEDGFAVTRNPGTSHPRQTDLCGRKEQSFFIVEAKAQTKNIGPDVISSVRDRLNRVTPDVFACVFNLGGFSKGVISELSQRRDRDILLFNGIEVHDIIDGRQSFTELISHKRDQLRLKGCVFVSGVRSPERPRSGLRVGPDVFCIGSEIQPWMRVNVGNDDIVFSNELLDCVGRMGRLLTLQLHLPIRQLSDVERNLNLLKRHLDLFGEGSFAIRQGRAGWFGFGLDPFMSALKEQKARYDELKWESYHHSEQVCYLDRINGGGLMGFSSTQSTGQGPFQFLPSMVEIYLPGIPVDLTAIRNLCKITRNETACFEMTERRPIANLRFFPKVTVEPVAQTISNAMGKQWTSGLVVRNPFRDAPAATEGKEQEQVTGLWRMIRSCEYLFCDLRNWHEPDSLMDAYELCWAEGVWIEGFYAIHVACDWCDRTLKVRSNRKESPRV